MKEICMLMKVQVDGMKVEGKRRMLKERIERKMKEFSCMKKKKDNKNLPTTQRSLEKKRRKQKKRGENKIDTAQSNT